jgi:hypothetical protein
MKRNISGRNYFHTIDQTNMGGESEEKDFPYLYDMTDITFDPYQEETNENSQKEEHSAS